MNENKQAEPVGLCGHESCDCRGYCQKLQANPAEPVAQPYAHIYEFDSAVFGTHRSFSPSQWNGMKPTRTVVVYTHPAQPVQPAGAQHLRYTNDGALAECPCCGSLDVGGVHDTVNCYGCGLTVTAPRPLQNAINKWNQRTNKAPAAAINEVKNETNS